MKTLCSAHQICLKRKVCATSENLAATCKGHLSFFQMEQCWELAKSEQSKANSSCLEKEHKALNTWW